MFSQSVSVSNDFAPSRWLLRWATSARIETGFVCISISMCMCVVFCVCMRLFIGVNSFRCGKCIWVLVGCSFVRSFIRYHHHALYCTCTYVCVADRTKWRRTHLEGDGNETCCFWIRWVVTNQLNTSWVITAFEQADILLNIKCGESKHTCMRERERERATMPEYSLRYARLWRAYVFWLNDTTNHLTIGLTSFAGSQAYT